MTKRDDTLLGDRALNKRMRTTGTSLGSTNTSSSATASEEAKAMESPTTTSTSEAVTMASESATTKHAKSVKGKTVPKPKAGTSDSKVTTVRSIIPDSTRCVLDDAQVAPYEADFRERLERLSVYVNEAANVYAIAKLLPTATWGTYQPSSDHRNVLCNPATNQPVVIWIIGHIVSLWFARDGVPERQGSVTIVPLSAELGMQAASLISKFSTPASTVPNEHGLNLLRASTWQSTPDDDNPQLFENVYDAREAVRSKKIMDEYPVLDLQKDDLILVECKLTRYRTKDGDSKNWMQRAQMELVAISLLHKGVDRAAMVQKEPSQIDDLCI